MYLAGKGAVSDFINTKDERALYDEVHEKVVENKILAEKVMELESDEKFEKEELEAISSFHDVAAWAAYISGV